MLIVKVIDPYDDLALKLCDVRPGTAEEYAFCLGWLDGAELHVPRTPPVTAGQLQRYAKGWALGRWNRKRWSRAAEIAAAD